MVFVGGVPFGTEFEIKLSLYPHDACNLHKPAGTDKLATEQDTAAILQQTFQMRFDGSFSSRCVSAFLRSSVSMAIS